MNTTNPVHTYKELIVWQKATQLIIAVYLLTEQFPRDEIFGLVSQMRRASVAISSNIAEGRTRGYRKDFLRFLWMAYSSGAELETQIIVAKQLNRTRHLEYGVVDSILNEVMRMLNSMVRKLKIDHPNKL